MPSTSGQDDEGPSIQMEKSTTPSTPPPPGTTVDILPSERSPEPLMAPDSAYVGIQHSARNTTSRYPTHSHQSPDCYGTTFRH